jgi:hypothetical protein
MRTLFGDPTINGERTEERQQDEDDGGYWS